MTKAQKFGNKWATHQFSSECYSGEDYLTFERAFRTVLKDEATKGGFSLKKFLKNHYCCSAVLIDCEGRHAYQVRRKTPVFRHGDISRLK